jgi:SAM-dependent methyltransferase
MADYAEASLTYDNTRTSDDEIIDLFARKFDFRSGVPFLDFGCGTGNYLSRICARFDCEGYGSEPSDEMRRIAVRKNPDLEIKKGDHSSTGFPPGMFGLVFMTDVIHHVTDRARLLETLYAALRPGGLVAILTESHAQLGTRWFNGYFPSLEGNELARYPDIGDIERDAGRAGFVPLLSDVRASKDGGVVSEEFIRMVRERNYSMFRMLPIPEFERGLALLEGDRGKPIPPSGHGETVVWLRKEMRRFAG